MTVEPIRHRELTEAEVRGFCTTLYHACEYARTLAATWSLRKKKPTADELFNLAQWMDAACGKLTEIASEAETDGHTTDYLTQSFARLSKQVREESRE